MTSRKTANGKAAPRHPKKAAPPQEAKSPVQPKKPQTLVQRISAYLGGVRLEHAAKWGRLLPVLNDLTQVADGFAGEMHRASQLIGILFQNDAAFKGSLVACEENDAILQKVLSDMFRNDGSLQGDEATREIDWIWYRMQYRSCDGFIRFIVALKKFAETREQTRLENAPPDPEEGATIFGGDV